MAALGAALGAAVGAAVPLSRSEKDLMGSTANCTGDKHSPSVAGRETLR